MNTARERVEAGEVVRIGELASWAGVTPRTVRHYHAIGLLPEPERTLHGYREYAISDLLQMLRIRRLVGLGFRLEDIRRIVDGSADQSLDEALDELDRHLALQQRTIADQRIAIAALRASGDDDPKQLADVVGSLADAVQAEGVDVELESWLLATVGSIAGMSTAEVQASTTELLGDAGRLRALRSMVERFAALADTDVDEPEIARLVDDIAGEVGPAGVETGPVGPADAAGVLGVVSRDLSTAQARCLELLLGRLNGGAA